MRYAKLPPLSTCWYIPIGLLLLFTIPQTTHAQQQTIDFEGVAAGTVLSSVYGDGGFGPIAVTGVNNKCPDFAAAVIFDSNNPTGGDDDLGTPNEDFGGPGIGAGGEAGSPFENNTALNNLLIINECDGLGPDVTTVADPNDSRRSNTITLDFPEPVTVFSMDLVDKESNESEGVELFFDGGGSVAFPLASVENNGVGTFPMDNGGAGLGTENVIKVVITQRGSGAFDNIVFAPTIDMECEECDGGVTSMTLNYSGSVGDAIVIQDSKGKGKDKTIHTYFDGTWDGSPITVNGTKDDGKFESNELAFIVNGVSMGNVHVSCSQPFGPGLTLGDFTVVAGTSKKGGPICKIPPPPPPGACQECDGGVTSMTLNYSGSVGDAIVIQDSKGKGKDKTIHTYFDGTWDGSPITVNGTKDDGKFESNELAFIVNGVSMGNVHVSCSQPFGPGLTVGDFTVTEGTSKKGGPICEIPPPPPTPDCDECKGGVTSMTLQYTGPGTDFIEVRDSKAKGKNKSINTYFSGTPDGDGMISLSGTKSDGKFESNELVFSVNGEDIANVHVSCSQPFGPGLSFGNFTVVAGTSKDNGPICEIPPSSDPVCENCKGGVTSLTLKYTGSVGDAIVIKDDKGKGKDGPSTYHDATWTGGDITINGTKSDGKFQSNELVFVVNGEEIANVHVSCSQPIGIGMIFGDFEVIAGSSKDNGAFCQAGARMSFADRPTIYDMKPNNLGLAPLETSLDGNYPNPFNPMTTIRFTVARESLVRLTVFDVLGRKVKVLVDGVMNTGQHSVSFDATSLPGGTYFYHMETPEGTFTSKMVLLK